MFSVKQTFLLDRRLVVFLSLDLPLVPGDEPSEALRFLE